MKLGLSLSGGGFRATLFHLGVLQLLHETNLLKDITHICSVSGGSILSGHLVKCWTDYLEPNKFENAAVKVVQLARYDVRGRIVRRLPLKAIIWPFMRSTTWQSTTWRSTLFQNYLEKFLYHQCTLQDLYDTNQTRPKLEILATNLTSGSLTIFSDDGFCPDTKDKFLRVSPNLSFAVSASSAFPGFFPPIRTDHKTIGVDRADMPSSFALSDGGIFDNLGIRRFNEVSRQIHPSAFDGLILSDAGGAFDWTEDRFGGLIETALRTSEVLMRRIGQLEYEAMAALINVGHLYSIKISDTIQRSSHLLREDDQRNIKHIRTDLDAFSKAEINALVAHGYCIARMSLQYLLAATLDREALARLNERKPWVPFALGEMEDVGWSRAIKKGRSRKKRLLSLRDPITIPYCLLLLFLFYVSADFVFKSILNRERIQSTMLSNEHLADQLIDAASSQAVAPAVVSTVKPIEVSTFPDIDWSDFITTTDDRVLDLREWNAVSPEEKERVSHAVLNRTTVMRKKTDTDVVIFGFGTIGYPLDIECLSHQYRLEYCYGPNSGSKRIMYRYHSVLNISGIPVGHEFLVRHSVTYGNNFLQREAGFSWPIQSMNNVEEMSILILYPSDKEIVSLQPLYYEIINETTYGRPKLYDGDVLLDAQKCAIYWRVFNPLPKHIYQLNWNWSDKRR